MKKREKKLMIDLLKLMGTKPYKGGLAIDIVQSDKQLHYYLDKWARNNWWEYGVTLRGGWFTPKGIDHFKKIMTETNPI